MKTLRFTAALILTILIPLLAFGASGGKVTTAPSITPVSVGINLPVRDDGDEDSVAFEYGFEDGWNGWTTVDLTDPGVTWHSSTRDTLNGRNFWSGKEELEGYADHWLQYLVSPVLNLQGRQNLRLTFNVKWACEDPQNGPPPDTGYTAPYDGWDGCNVWISTDNGDSWDVIRPVRPAYNYESLFSFGWEWGMGPDIPGWCGFSDGWQNAEFNISAYAQNNVKIRWAFCTDPAWNTEDDANAIGMLVDNLVVRDGNGVIWQNNGDALGDMSRDQGPVSGDHWELTEDDSHTGRFSAHCPIGENLRNALVSPAIEVPEGGYYTYFDFWVRADTRKPDSDGDTGLDDFFEVEVSTDGADWQRVIYDYGRELANGDPNPDWVDEFHYYGPDTTFRNDYEDWQRKLNLSQFAGQEVYLRWNLHTDSDVSDDQGSGIYIDDMRILISERRQDDVKIDWSWIKYPTAMGFNTQGRISVTNVGMGDQARVVKKYRIGQGSDVAITPWDGLMSDSTKEYGFLIQSDRILFADSTTITTFVSAQYDEANGNDTIVVKNVVIYPPNIWRLGYDNREYTLASNFARGSGPLIKFTPVDDNIRGTFDVKALRVRWNGAQGDQDVETRMHIYRDARGEIGAELFSGNIVVRGEDLLPGVHTIDLTQIQAVQGMSTNFWVWFEILRDDNFPQIIGDDVKFGEGHYFRYDGGNATDSNHEWQAHAILMPAGAAQEDELIAGRSRVDLGEVGLGDTKTMRLALFNGGINEVTVTSVTSGNNLFDVDFAGPVTLKIGDMAAVYISYTAENLQADSTTLTIESSDGTPPAVRAVARGVVNAVNPIETAPAEYGLGNAYPNPFNSTTVIPFTLGTAVYTRLAVYDLSGRRVATLLNGRMEAGTHAASFEAGTLSTGVYLYRLDAGDFSSIRKVIVVK